MRTPIIAGNWKMNKTVDEALDLVRKLKESLKDVKDREIVVCPSFVALYAVAKEIEGSNIKLGAQNCYYEDNGAYTGEVSPVMLKDIGVEYVVIGHSERRSYFAESDDLVNKKAKALLKKVSSPSSVLEKAWSREKLERRRTSYANRSSAIWTVSNLIS